MASRSCPLRAELRRGDRRRHRRGPAHGFRADLATPPLWASGSSRWLQSGRPPSARRPPPLVDGQFELRDLGEFEVKGTPTPQRVLELVGPGAARTRLQAVAATRGLSRFVGRDADLAVLESALQDALAGEGRAVGIVGDPGVGKSRLVHELVADCTARGVSGHRSRGRRPRSLRPAHGHPRPLSRLLRHRRPSTHRRWPASGWRARCLDS